VSAYKNSGPYLVLKWGGKKKKTAFINKKMNHNQTQINKSREIIDVEWQPNKLIVIFPSYHQSMSLGVGSSSINTDEIDERWVPEGYVRVVGPDQTEYMVPEFMIPTIRHQFISCKKREELKTDNAEGTVSAD
jgi:hypothetical protein